MHKPKKIKLLILGLTFGILLGYFLFPYLKSSSNQTPPPSQAAAETPTALTGTILGETEDKSLPKPELTKTPSPVALRIPSINLSAPVIGTGLEKNGTLRVPSSPDQTGWYNLGPKPGEKGPSVITGHYDSKAGPGVLFNLKNVKSGNEISIVRDDGSTAIFTVDKAELYLQDDFPTQKVYGTIPAAGLRIITCAGTYNKAVKSYSHNLVVFATLKEIRQPGSYQPL